MQKIAAVGSRLWAKRGPLSIGSSRIANKSLRLMSPNSLDLYGNGMYGNRRFYSAEPTPEEHCENEKFRTKIELEMNEFSNISQSILSKVDSNLVKVENHPLEILSRKITLFMQSRHDYRVFDELSPIVTVGDNFDFLLVPPNHVSRAKTDTYYITQDKVLRCHTSAHQRQVLQQNGSAFLVYGNVFRRDEIDPTHYPIFHQLEGIRLFNQEELNYLKMKFKKSDSDLDISDLQSCHDRKDVQVVANHLKQELEGLVTCLFGNVEFRWVKAYFPFTCPSYELEIFYQNEWLEVLGCGVVEQNILEKTNRSDELGWAFGIGLERIAMVLFNIPDIRLFWSTDKRFLDQFSDGMVKQFKPFSKYPICYKDTSFWIPETFHDNDFMELVRECCGDYVEKVKLIDTFKKKDRVSKCFRIEYRSMDRTLTNEEVDKVHSEFLKRLESELKVELR